MYLLGIDFETTGLDPEKDVITEVGAVLWDWESQQPIMMLSELVKDPGTPEVSEFITELTGITNEMLEAFGLPLVKIFGRLHRLVKSCDYIVAHNAAFDKAFYDRAYPQLISQIFSDSAGFEKPWLCTKLDVPYSKKIKSRHLRDLAIDHEFLNPFPHRAVTDVLTMFKVLKNYDILEVIRISQSPMIILKALVSFEEKDLAKQAGFTWTPDRKAWLKEGRECVLREEANGWPFQVSRVGGE